MKPAEKLILALLAVFLFADYLLGMVLIDLIGIDAPQYASIAREMAENGQWLKVQHRLTDYYMDKPPLLFWLSAISIKLFGVTDFAYRLPSVLFNLLGAWAVYRFAKSLYASERVGRIAFWMWAACQAFFLLNHDVRTDTILAGAVVTAMWQLHEYLKRKKAFHFVLAFFFMGIAFMEKGPIGLMVPLLGFGTEWAVKGRWKEIFHLRWLAGLLIFVAVISPMLWSVYSQYGTEGLRFHFWTQSFGRITGESKWKDSSTPFFFVHTFLWSFAPWMLLTVAALAGRLAHLARTRLKVDKETEFITVGSIVLPFVALSMSHYKLPHYIFVFFPMAAMLTASYTEKLTEKAAHFRRAFAVQTVLGVCIWILAALLFVWAFPATNYLLFVPLLIPLAAFIFYVQNREVRWQRIVFPGVAAMIALNFVLNVWFYPQLVTYQPASTAWRYVKDKNIDPKSLYFVGTSNHVMEFYLETIIPFREPEALTQEASPFWVFANEEGKAGLEKAGLSPIDAVEIPDFQVVKVNLGFLNPKTRPSTLKKCYLLHYLPHESKVTP